MIISPGLIFKSYKSVTTSLMSISSAIYIASPGGGGVDGSVNNI